MNLLNNHLWLAVFIGGGIGSVVRYVIGKITSTIIQINFPMATLMANVVSCIVFGITLLFIQQKTGNTDTVKALIITGFCGGLSTFSTFSYENFMLLKSGNYFFVVLNILLSVGVCIALFLWLLKRV